MPKSEEGEKPPRRARLFRRFMKVPLLRRYYTRRVLRFLDKSHKKGRPIPEQLADLDRHLARLPAKERQKVLDATLSGEMESAAGRAVRRAAQRQNRQSGRGGGRQRPGYPPGPRPRAR
ncbi:MAG TPA: hypothetical protein VE990_10395 [Acidimicrobiales bacterium]|nr:hypothetical protein [Acidimicrobiales bacterium]